MNQKPDGIDYYEYADSDDVEVYETKSPVYAAVKDFPTCVHCGCFITDGKGVFIGPSQWHHDCWARYSEHLKRVAIINGGVI